MDPARERVRQYAPERKISSGQTARAAIQPVSAEAFSTEEANTEESLSHHEIIKRDLLVVVVAQGVVCTAVTVFKKITNHDYVATCEGGNKYRVNVSDDGRVNVAPHKSPE